jgi:hypothetical protein
LIVELFAKQIENDEQRALRDLSLLLDRGAHGSYSNIPDDSAMTQVDALAIRAPSPGVSQLRRRSQPRTAVGHRRSPILTLRERPFNPPNQDSPRRRVWPRRRGSVARLRRPRRDPPLPEGSEASAMVGAQPLPGPSVMRRPIDADVHVHGRVARVRAGAAQFGARQPRRRVRVITRHLTRACTGATSARLAQSCVRSPAHTGL